MMCWLPLLVLLQHAGCMPAPLYTKSGHCVLQYSSNADASSVNRFDYQLIQIL
jgi:hypothetical protein